MNAVVGARSSEFFGTKFISEGYLDIAAGSFLNESFLWIPPDGDKGLL